MLMIVNLSKGTKVIFSFNFLLVIILCELYTMCFYHIHYTLPDSFQIHLPSRPNKICGSFFERLIQYSLCCPQMLGCSAFHWSMVSKPLVILLKETAHSSSSSYQMPISLVNGETLCSPSRVLVGILCVLRLHGLCTILQSL